MRGVKAIFLRNLARLGLKRAEGLKGQVGVLVGGTSFAQALAFLSLPFLTRLYTPADFALLAVYTALLGIIVSVACLRFEIAIPLPKSDSEGVILTALALLSTTIISVILAGFILGWKREFALILGQPAMESFLWLLPLGVWLGGVYAAMQYWATRKKQFGLIARTRVTRSISGTAVQLGSGVLGLGPIGLLLGQILNVGAGVTPLIKYFKRNIKNKPKAVSLKKIVIIWRKYDSFPKYSTWEALTNSAGIQLPVLLIAGVVLGPEAGFLMLAMRVMAIPMMLIGSSVSQVYISEAPNRLRDETLDSFTVYVLKKLFLLGTGPILIAGITAPALFPLVFGEEWGRAGEIVLWMTPWFILQFLVSPISMSLHVLGRQTLALNLQVFGLLLRVGAVVVAARYFNDLLVEVYALSGAVFYSIYALVLYKVLNLKSNNLYTLLRNIIFYFLLATGIAVFLYLITNYIDGMI